MVLFHTKDDQNSLSCMKRSFVDSFLLCKGDILPNRK